MSDTEVFKAAVKLAPEERANYLDEACGTNRELRREVESLLQAHDQPGSFLNCPPVGGTGGYDNPDAVVGMVIAGKYKLLEPIGEGGMGSVFMAQQTEPVKRMVAVKVIKAGMDSKQVLMRFEAERQALAMMDHPNIARVLDAGTTESNHPYFVMELVKGVPITKFCDDRKLSPRERLDLFVPVCQAIQHAHQKGVIHRDIKPSNVLVALYDDRPAPKVIDFGVAKATGQQLTDGTMFTGFGTVVGTAEYMSPEQAGFNQLDVDTRSDVYALGVLLYELLTGSTPLDRKSLGQAALLEVLRIVREVEPPAPSRRLSTDAGLANIAANRHTEPTKLARLMRGELDWVVMKALEKDRARRYETANGLARDIQRYLADEVVEAKPPTAGYRLRKFVRRNRGQVVAAGLVLLALIGGVIGTTYGLLAAKKQEALALAERDAKDVALKAEQQAREDEKKARQQAFAALRSMTADVVERKFTQGTVLTEDDRAFLRGIIAQYDAFAAIKGDDVDSRALRAEGRYRVGNMRSTLGELREAEQDLDQAQSIYRQLAADFPARPDFRQDLAKSHNNRGNLLHSTGRLREAEQDFDQALSIKQQLAADFPARPEFGRDLASSHVNRGVLLYDTGRLKEAEQDYDRALSIYKQLVADFPSQLEVRQELAGSHNMRGLLLTVSGRPKEAEKDYEQALSIYKRLAVDFPSRPEVRQSLGRGHNNRGMLLYKMGRIQVAEQDFNQALSIHKQLAADFPLQPEFRQNLATTHYNLGILFRDTGRPKEAGKEFDQSQSHRKQLAAEFPAVPAYRQELATDLDNVGLLLTGLGNRPEAEQQYRKALAIRKQLAAEFPAASAYRVELGNSYCVVGAFVRDGDKPSDSLEWFAKAIGILDAICEQEPRDVNARNTLRISYLNRAFAHDRLQQYADAIRDWDKAIELSPKEEQPGIRIARARSRLQAGKVADAVAEVAELTARGANATGLARSNASQWYDFACFFAVASGKVADKKDEYAKRAVELLRQAVKAGFKNAAHMRKDTDLDSLRDREDFKKLMAELETKPESPAKE